MKNLDNNFVEQAKWILKHGNVNYLTSCPVFTCNYCVVHHNRVGSGCSIKQKKDTAKYYLRNEKLKRISK